MQASVVFNQVVDWADLAAIVQPRCTTLSMAGDPLCDLPAFAKRPWEERRVRLFSQL